MTLIGSDFVKVNASRPCHCSECGHHIAAGAQCLESIRSGKVRKRVCSEDCRLTFDDNYWQEKARERELAVQA